MEYGLVHLFLEGGLSLGLANDVDFAGDVDFVGIYEAFEFFEHLDEGAVVSVG